MRQNDTKKHAKVLVTCPGYLNSYDKIRIDIVVCSSLV